MKDPQMAVIRHQINELIERCAVAAELGGPAAVRALKIVESDDVPPRPPPARLEVQDAR